MAEIIKKERPLVHIDAECRTMHLCFRNLFMDSKLAELPDWATREEDDELYDAHEVLTDYPWPFAIQIIGVTTALYPLHLPIYIVLELLQYIGVAGPPSGTARVVKLVQSVNDSIDRMKSK